MSKGTQIFRVTSGLSRHPIRTSNSKRFGLENGLFNGLLNSRPRPSHPSRLRIVVGWRGTRALASHAVDLPVGAHVERRDAVATEHHGLVGVTALKAGERAVVVRGQPATGGRSAMAGAAREWVFAFIRAIAGDLGATVLGIYE